MNSCATTSNSASISLRNGAARTAELPIPEIRTTLTLVDLKVSETKVTATVKGTLPLVRDTEHHSYHSTTVVAETEKFLEELKEKAIDEALKRSDNADVLVGPMFFYDRQGREATMRVVGYPAHYINFRSYEPTGKEGGQGGFCKRQSHGATVKVAGPSNRHKNVGPNKPKVEESNQEIEPTTEE